MTEALVRRSSSQALFDESRQSAELFERALKSNDLESASFKQLGPIAQLAIRRKFALQAVPSHNRLWTSIIKETSAGGWQRNEEIAIETALRHPTVLACVRLIQTDIGKMRPQLKELREGVYVEVENIAYSPVLRKPNHYQSMQRFLETWVNSKVVFGNAYILKVRDARSVVQALYVLDPLRVGVLQAPDGSVFYELHPELSANVRETVIVPAREMIHDIMPPAVFHPLQGVSPLYAASAVAWQGLNIQGNSTNFFANGAQPGGILVVPGAISQEKADEIKTYWQASFTGGNAGKVALLTGGMTYTPIEPLKSTDAQVVEQLNWVDEKICTAFGMPPHKVGVGDQPNYNNIEALNQQYLSECLDPYVLAITSLLTDGLSTRPYVVDLDLHSLLRMDTQTKVKSAAEGIRAGILAPNEARRIFFDLPPVDGGDSPYLQHQDYPLEALAERVAPDAEGVVDSTSEPDAAPPSSPSSGSEGIDSSDALNGAQVSSLLEILTLVATGQLPRDSALAAIQAAFNIDRDTADAILGSIGNGFVPSPLLDGNDPAPQHAQEDAEKRASVRTRLKALVGERLGRAS